MPPAKECENGKWKWGDTGECIYESEQEAIDENEDYNETEEAKRDLVGTMITDGIELPLFSTIEEAEAEAEAMGGSGYHEHILDGNTYYMPFNSHDEALEALSSDETEEIEEESIKEQKSINIWDNKFNDSMEKRIINIETSLETRQEEDGKETDVVVGYGSIFNSRSNDLGGFYEYIAEGAITDDVVNSSDIRALINHNMDKILARSVNGSGTLKLNTDSKGMRYEFEIPDTSYGKDLKINMQNGNLNQSSFAFTLADNGDEWSTDDDGNNIRTITKIDKIFDISIVTYPAYSQAERDLVVAQRGLASYKETLKNEDEENDLVIRSLASLKIELAKRK